LTFGVLIFGGYAINKEKPPIPFKVLDHSGSVLFTGEDVIGGQNYFYSRGGQHIGTIWGHGAYLAPDWSADFLHRMGLFLAARHKGLGAVQIFWYISSIGSARVFSHAWNSCRKRLKVFFGCSLREPIPFRILDLF
jgi:nitric oxide reductase large subunit